MPRASLLSSAVAAALVVSVLAVSTPPADSAAARSPEGDTARAVDHLDDDASGSLSVLADESGTYHFMGVPAGAVLDDPAVSESSSVSDAAAAHLERYGAAFGSARAGTSFTRSRVDAAVNGDVVRYQQQVEGVPVLGGEIVMSLRPDRELSSVLSRTTTTSSLAAATVPEAAAAETARAAFVDTSGARDGITVAAQGRFVLDQELIGGTTGLPTRTVWRFEVSRDVDEDRLILVDDRTGGVLLDADQVEHADRVVCDQAGAQVANVSSCTSSFARTEAGAPSGVADVNTAFTRSGEVSDFYGQVGGVDLTDLLGITVSATKHLAQTVRVCVNGSACPYVNAFWSSSLSQMFYGAGYITDDVVGHEMTHGVIDKNSGLFYWGQSGAMNEGIADIMGELIDQRTPDSDATSCTSACSSSSWLHREDYSAGPNRSLKDPTLYNDPDKMTSTLYVKEACCAYSDQDGVHTNSGVATHTGYLISQGGTFNGQTITGIDAGDPTFARSGKLWLLAIQTLSSGSDYADLAAVLDQSCQTLLASGTAGFSSATCTAVHQATLATELTTTPTKNPQPADAPATCPTGSTTRELFNSETGEPTTKFLANAVWSRNGVPGWGQVAHSGTAWGGNDIATAGTNSLVMASGVALPAGQTSYLWFQHWRLLQYTGSSTFTNIDAGTVEVDDVGDAATPVDVSSVPWVNGPTDTIATGYGNLAQGRKGFGNDSRGYVASRADLSGFAGAVVKPQFTMNTSSSTQFLGWWLDDISIYTCDPIPVTAPPPPPVLALVAGAPKITGKALVGKNLTVGAGTWGPAPVSLTYQWLRNGAVVAGATGTTYKLTNKDKGKKMSVRVTGSKAGYTGASATSPQTKKVKKKKKKS